MLLLAVGFSLLVLFKHSLHYAIQVEVDQLLVGGQEFETSTGINKLETCYLSDVVVIEHIFFIGHLLTHSLSSIQREHRSWFKFRDGGQGTFVVGSCVFL